MRRFRVSFECRLGKRIGRRAEGALHCHFPSTRVAILAASVCIIGAAACAGDAKANCPKNGEVSVECAEQLIPGLVRPNVDGYVLRATTADDSFGDIQISLSYAPRSRDGLGVVVDVQPEASTNRGLAARTEVVNALLVGFSDLGSSYVASIIVGDTSYRVNVLVNPGDSTAASAGVRMAFVDSITRRLGEQTTH